MNPFWESVFENRTMRIWNATLGHHMYGYRQSDACVRLDYLAQIYAFFSLGIAEAVCERSRVAFMKQVYLVLFCMNHCSHTM